MDEKIAKLMRWMVEEAKNNPYSEIGIKIILHDGRIKKSEKILIEKMEGEKR